MQQSRQTDNLDFDYKYGFAMPERAVYKTPFGLSPKVVKQISRIKGEPKWMTDFRLKSYKIFLDKSMPEWGADLSRIDFDRIVYFLKSTEGQMDSWEDLPSEIKETYDKIGVPEAEKNFLAGVSAQYDSEVVYESVKKELTKQGVLFCDMDTALAKYPRIVKKYFGTLIPPHDNKFAALNSTVWSGGSFVYVPKGIRVKLPLQAYFRINAERFGQFERTLIIAEEGSQVHYVEGCTAPIYVADSLHAAVVEIFVKPGARVRYTTVQNWSNNVYNLVTKRARVQEDAVMEWIDCNIGSKVTMKYPSVMLMGEGARGEVLSIAYAGEGQHQDAGAKMFH
ncbi:MAG: Fe-S cluster assembly protein SufB, partial [Candidatus Paceibacterota bacterium]